MSRPAALDRALCLHEAAHAVTAEALRSGCVLGVEMDYVPGTATFHGAVYGAYVAAVCAWRFWYYDDPDCHTALAAGREGEKLGEWGIRLDDNDRGQLRVAASPTERARARRRAASLVRKHSLAVRRLAKALGDRRSMTGDEIRALIA